MIRNKDPSFSSFGVSQATMNEISLSAQMTFNLGVVSKVKSQGVQLDGGLWSGDFIKMVPGQVVSGKV